MAGSERGTGAPTAAPTGVPFEPENNIRAAWATAFQDATHQGVDAFVKDATAAPIPPTATTPSRLAPPPPT